MSSRATAPHYQLSGSTDLAGELCRIGLAELRFARAEAALSAADPDALHQCRKSIKRLRALARFAGSSDACDCKGLDRELGRIARQLSEARDAGVLSRTAASLEAPASSRRARRPRLPDARPDPQLVTAVVAELAAMEPKLEQLLAAPSVSIAGIGRRLGEGFDAAERRMRRFIQSGHPEDAHAWRKVVQRLHNQLRLVAGVAPASTRARIATLDELAGHLGDYQDLSVLQAALTTGRIRCKPGTRSRLRRAAKARQRELGRAALKLGRRLFRQTETPAAVAPGPVVDAIAIAAFR